MADKNRKNICIHAALAVAIMCLAGCTQAPKEPEEDIPTFTSWRQAYDFGFQASAHRAHPIAAVKVFEKWVDQARTEGAHTKELAGFLVHYAYALHDSNPEKIAALSTEALQVDDSLPADKRIHPKTEFTACWLAGWSNFQLKKYAEAEGFFKRGLTVWSTHKEGYKMEMEGVHNMYDRLIESLENQGKKEEAAKYKEELKNLK